MIDSTPYYKLQKTAYQSKLYLKSFSSPSNTHLSQIIPEVGHCDSGSGEVAEDFYFMKLQSMVPLFEVEILTFVASGRANLRTIVIAPEYNPTLKDSDRIWLARPTIYYAF